MLPDAPDRILRYDVALPYASDVGLRTLPWCHVGIDFLGGAPAFTRVRPLLDTGAEMTVFDGRAASSAGLSWREVVRRAVDVKPIHGVSRTGRPIEGHELDVICYVGSAVRFAELRFRVLVTPPDSIAFPVLGRGGFFDQVDVTFVHAERYLYLRFRDPAIGRIFA